MVISEGSYVSANAYDVDTPYHYLDSGTDYAVDYVSLVASKPKDPEKFAKFIKELIHHWELVKMNIEAIICPFRLDLKECTGRDCFEPFHFRDIPLYCGSCLANKQDCQTYVQQRKDILEKVDLMLIWLQDQLPKQPEPYSHSLG